VTEEEIKRRLAELEAMLKILQQNKPKPEPKETRH
jgi:hypothetical protein